MNNFAYVMLIFAWVAGIVLANGFWSTFFALVLPLWGWYLIIERVLIYIGFA